MCKCWVWHRLFQKVCLCVDILPRSPFTRLVADNKDRKGTGQTPLPGLLESNHDATSSASTAVIQSMHRSMFVSCKPHVPLWFWTEKCCSKCSHAHWCRNDWYLLSHQESAVLVKNYNYISQGPLVGFMVFCGVVTFPLHFVIKKSSFKVIKITRFEILPSAEMFSPLSLVELTLCSLCLSVWAWV